MRKIYVFLLILYFTSPLFSQSYSGGSGTSDDPYRIANKYDLKYLSEHSGDWSKHFIQTANILFSPSDFEENGDFYNGGAGFIPIGNDWTPFGGTYDGNYFYIDGLVIKRSGTLYIGLFGYTIGSVSPNIKNLGVTNATIEGDRYTGALVGKNVSSPIENCYSSGSVTGSWFVGGLIGYNSGSTILNSYSTCSVNGTSEYNGGFIGYNESSLISNNYCTGNVTRKSGTSLFYAAFIGWNNARIEYCYSTGSIFYSGSTNPTDKGFIASDNGGEYYSNFFDSEASNQSTAIGATAKSTSEMKTHTTFISAGWDFVGETDNGTNDYWDMDYSQTINSGYPYLYWQDGDDASLAVTLSSFTASGGDGVVNLKWTTESEIGNEAFIIERSTNKIDFQLLAEIKGQGNKSTKTTYEFNDYNVVNGITYYYRLADRDYDGAIEYHNVISATPLSKNNYNFTNTTVKEFKLLPVFPNPANPSTTICFNIPNIQNTDKYVNLLIYNNLGKKVSTLLNGYLQGGKYKIKWNGKNDNGVKQPSGIYFIVLQSTNYSEAQKILLIK